MTDYLLDRRSELAFLAFQHLSLVVQSLVLATLLGVTLAVLVQRRPRLAAFATGVSSVGLTIPSFALLGIALAIFQTGVPAAVAAVVFYGALLIMRNALVGLAGVDPALREAARGLGMGRTRRLLRVELPLAWPVTLAGMRVAAQLMMGVAAVAAYVSGPGLGGLVFSGLSRLGGANSVEAAVTGTLGVLVVALLLDLVLVALGRLTTPRGIRV
jgi:osmoprotectant transport system permease protein